MQRPAQRSAAPGARRGLRPRDRRASRNPGQRRGITRRAEGCTPERRRSPWFPGSYCRVQNAHLYENNICADYGLSYKQSWSESRPEDASFWGRQPSLVAADGTVLPARDRLAGRWTPEQRVVLEADKRLALVAFGLDPAESCAPRRAAIFLRDGEAPPVSIHSCCGRELSRGRPAYRSTIAWPMVASTRSTY
jgi:hypothetical protein